MKSLERLVEMDYVDSLKKYAPVIVRIGIALVVLWFGSSQVSNPVPWLQVLPDWTKSLPVGQLNLIYFNGWFEIIFGAMLLLGFYTRLTALLIALHILDITITVGFNGVGVRDFGLTLASFAIFFYGSDIWSVDRFFIKNII